VSAVQIPMMDGVMDGAFGRRNALIRRRFGRAVHNVHNVRAGARMCARGPRARGRGGARTHTRARAHPFRTYGREREEGRGQ
jgi:hypothetical protein